MKIETKFDLGQTVWRIGRRRESVTLPCKFCRGSSSIRVEAPSGSDYAYVSCPKCQGRGGLSIGAVPLFEVIGSAVVGKIEVKVVDVGAPGFNGFGDTEREKESYMLDATGFPSGSVFYHVDLFATETEALVECDDRNERLRAGALPNEWKPDRHAYSAAQAFLDHSDVYEHGPEHVEAAHAIVDAYEYEPDMVEA